jgi:hypothetical protein
MKRAIPYRRPGFLLLLAAAIAPSVMSGESQPPAQKKAPFYLIADYLSPAVYEGDSLTACFRIENTTGIDSILSLAVVVLDEAGKELSRKAESIKATAKEFASCQRDVGTSQGAKVRYVLLDGSETVATLTARLVRDADPWPATLVRNARLETAQGGEVVVPVVRKRLKVENRAFVPLKWIVDGGSGAKPAIKGKAASFAPARWQLGKPASGPEIGALGPYVRDGAVPVLRTVDQVLAKCGPSPAAAAPIERAVIFLPPEDLELATDPRVYRLALDCLLAHLKRSGTRQLTLVPPLLYGSPEKHCLLLWQAVREAAAAYAVDALEPAAFLDEKLWRVDPQTASAYGASPNAEGTKKIEQALNDLLP